MLEGAVLTPLFPTEVPDCRKDHLTTRPQLHTRTPPSSTRDWQGPCSSREPRRGVLLASNADLGQDSRGSFPMEDITVLCKVPGFWTLDPGPCVSIPKLVEFHCCSQRGHIT